MPKVGVIIPAAGAGKRFGGDVKKPFAQLDGRPLFIRSIELFVNRPDVCQTILAVAADDYDVVKEKYAANLMFMGIRLVRGGQERYESVRAALAELDPAAELVCVHDAVRPCVLDSWIDRVFERAAQTGAAILAAPLTGTIKRAGKAPTDLAEKRPAERTGVESGSGGGSPGAVSGGGESASGKSRAGAAGGEIIEQTVPRAGLYEAQTPQVFRKELLAAAYAAMPSGWHPTDDSQVVERNGGTVSIVATDRRNIKITGPGDMSLAEGILKDFARQKRASAGPRGPFQEAQW